MPDEPAALSTVAPLSAEEAAYEAIYATVITSERGRAFLEEYARRTRHADTLQMLAAIARVENLIRERSGEPYQSFRAELTEMANVIAQTRSEAANLGVGGSPETHPAPAEHDNFATVERIKDVAWTMRERGIDPATCDEIEEIASSVLSAAALRDPADRRAQKLADVLGDLERRVNAMLASVAGGEPAPPAAMAIPAAEPQPVAEPPATAEPVTEPPATAEPVAEPPAAIAAPQPPPTPMATYGVSPIDFVPATKEPPAEPSESEPPSKPAAIANSSADVMREIELELFAADEASAKDAAPEAARAALLQQVSLEVARETAAAPAPQQPAPNDPLAALKALSEEERIALFT